MKIELTAMVCLIGLVLSLLSGTVLLRYHRKQNSSQRILALYFYTVGYLLLITFLIAAKFIEIVPHFFRTGILAAYVFPPLAYLYVRESIQPGIRKRDLLYFLPALLYLIDFLPFYFLSADDKMKVINNVTGSHIESLLAHKEGWLTPPWFHMFFRNAVSLLYWILSFRLMWRLRNMRQSQFYIDNAAVLNWLWAFVIFQFFIFAPYILLVLVGLPQYTFYTSVIPFTLMVCVTCIFLFFRPTIFYGFSGMLFISERDELKGSEEGEPKPATAWRRHKLELEYARADEVGNLRDSISEFLDAHQPYLLAGYSIHDFSRDIGVPARKLSAFINNAEGMNFRDFLNKQRIGYCKQNLIIGSWHNLTLEAIAEQCGFNNRNSFTSAFKKFVGTNPSEFVHSLREDKGVEI